jgi:hypothetical protein
LLRLFASFLKEARVPLSVSIFFSLCKAQKRIFTAIGAMLPQAFFCLETKETKVQGPQITAQKLRRFSLQTANRSSLAIAATQLYAVLPLEPSLFFTPFI